MKILFLTAWNQRRNITKLILSSVLILPHPLYNLHCTKGTQVNCCTLLCFISKWKCRLICFPQSQNKCIEFMLVLVTLFYSMEFQQTQSGPSIYVELTVYPALPPSIYRVLGKNSSVHSVVSHGSLTHWFLPYHHRHQQQWQRLPSSSSPEKE